MHGQPRSGLYDDDGDDDDNNDDDEDSWSDLAKISSGRYFCNERDVNLKQS